MWIDTDNKDAGPTTLRKVSHGPVSETFVPFGEENVTGTVSIIQPKAKSSCTWILRLQQHIWGGGQEKLTGARILDWRRSRRSGALDKSRESQENISPPASLGDGQAEGTCVNLIEDKFQSN